MASISLDLDPNLRLGSSASESDCVFLFVFNHSVMSDSLQHHGLQPARLLCPWDSPGKNTGVGSYSLLEGIFLIQRSNMDLLHCKTILYHLNHQGSPKCRHNSHYFSHCSLPTDLSIWYMFSIYLLSFYFLSWEVLLLQTLHLGLVFKSILTTSLFQLLPST